MRLKCNAQEAKDTLNALIAEGSEFLEAGVFEVAEAKLMANDWYQHVVEAVSNIFFSADEIIEEMNDVLSKEEKPFIVRDIGLAFGIKAMDLQKARINFIDKLEKILAILGDQLRFI